jgi:hypothetical protein
MPAARATVVAVTVTVMKVGMRLTDLKLLCMC